MNNINTPSYINSGIALDDRGSIEFFNNLYEFKSKRFYIINNNQDNFIRAWHAHKKESKLFYCLDGSVQISAIKIDSFKSPSKNLKIDNFYLSDKTNKLVFIPRGYANGLKFFNKLSRLLVFS